MPKIVSTQGQNHTDVILSDDKPGWRTSTTRQRSFELTELMHLIFIYRIFGNLHTLFMRASNRERQSFAYFSSAVALKTRGAFLNMLAWPEGWKPGMAFIRKVRRHQAKLRRSASDYVCARNKYSDIVSSGKL